MEITKQDKKRWLKIAQDRLVDKYGLGKGHASAWYHMSAEQREDAWITEAARLVLAQDSSIADRLTFAQAQEMLRLVTEQAAAAA
jgi:hypothetical protein